MALASIATMAPGFVVQVHPVFATGIPFLASLFFPRASLADIVHSAMAAFARIVCEGVDPGARRCAGTG